MKSKLKSIAGRSIMYRRKPIDAGGLFIALIISPILLLFFWMASSGEMTITSCVSSLILLVSAILSFFWGFGSQIWQWRADYLLRMNCLKWVDQYFPNKTDRPISDFLYKFCEEVDKRPSDLSPATLLGPLLNLPPEEIIWFLGSVLSQADLHGIELEGFCGKTLGSVIEVIPPNDQTKQFWLWSLLGNNVLQGVVFFFGFFFVLILIVIWL